jgi:hypothetical protein
VRRTLSQKDIGFEFGMLKVQLVPSGSRCAMYVVSPRCLDDILRCGVYGTFAVAYHEM